jgi:3-oxoacyl-[acyl-carrier protein] reductase
MTLEEVQTVFAVNVFGAILVYQLLMPLMAREGGSVVTITSIRGMKSTASEEIPVYSASKAAAENLTASMAKRYAPRLRVNAVSPGFTLTDMTSSWSDAVQNEARRSLLERPAETGEIAAAACFLLSDEAKFITGETLVVDGGYSLRTR